MEGQERTRASHRNHVGGSVVYFAVDFGLQRVKIGYAKDVFGRFLNIRKLLGDLHKVVDMRCVRVVYGDQVLEAELHLRFDHLRYREECEWFHWTDEVQAYVESTQDVFDITGNHWLMHKQDYSAATGTRLAWFEERNAKRLKGEVMPFWRCRCDECHANRDRLGLIQPRPRKWLRTALLARDQLSLQQ